MGKSFNMKVFKTYCLLLVLLFGAQSVGVQGLSGSDRKELWKEISQYFQPPAEYAKGLYPKLRMEGYDLHELHALMAPRPFLVSGGSSDPVQRWIPLNHSIAINNFLGYKNRVAMHNRPDHSPNAESNEIVYKFFQYFL